MPVSRNFYRSLAAGAGTLLISACATTSDSPSLGADPDLSLRDQFIKSNEHCITHDQPDFSNPTKARLSEMVSDVKAILNHDTITANNDILADTKNIRICLGRNLGSNVVGALRPFLKDQGDPTDPSDDIDGVVEMNLGQNETEQTLVLTQEITHGWQALNGANPWQQGIDKQTRVQTLRLVEAHATAVQIGVAYGLRDNGNKDIWRAAMRFPGFEDLADSYEDTRARTRSACASVHRTLKDFYDSENRLALFDRQAIAGMENFPAFREFDINAPDIRQIAAHLRELPEICTLFNPDDPSMPFNKPFRLADRSLGGRFNRLAPISANELNRLESLYDQGKAPDDYQSLEEFYVPNYGYDGPPSTPQSAP